MYEMNRKVKIDGVWKTDLKYIHDYNTNQNLDIINRPKSKYGPQLVSDMKTKNNLGNL